MTSFPSVARPISAAVRRASIRLRPYQARAKAEIHQHWNSGSDNVLLVVPTGGGKTITFADILAEHEGAGCAIAHRQELVGQIAMALNQAGVRHRIMAPRKVVQLIVARQMRKQGVSFYDPNAPIGVAGVDVLAKADGGKWAAEFGPWLAQVTLWVQDEAHHVLKDNKWGRACERFDRPGKRVRGLGVTASPARADGKGLGRAWDGLFDVMVLGPTMRDLINSGYLTPYRILTVPCSAEYEDVTITDQGEFSRVRLVAAEKDTHLVGDIVNEYLKHAAGKRGVTFVSSVETAYRVAEEFNARGVPAMALDGTTDDDTRDEAVRKLESGELLQLVNCDLFGEGFDLPAIEVVSMGTATASLPRFIQWFGRALRLLIERQYAEHWDGYTDAERCAIIAASAKPFAIILDHGGNVIRHKGPPDIPHHWTLARGEKKGSAPSEPLPWRACLSKGLVLANPQGPSWEAFREQGWNDRDMLQYGHAVHLQDVACLEIFPSTLRSCPRCGYAPPLPAGRREPKQVEGDLQLLDEETLAQLRAEYDEAHLNDWEFRESLVAKGVPQAWAGKHIRDHENRRAALDSLAHVMSIWGGWWRDQGDTDAQMQRRFWHAFGVDVLTAQSLKREPAAELEDRIRKTLALDGVVIPT